VAKVGFFFQHARASLGFSSGQEAFLACGCRSRATIPAEKEERMKQLLCDRSYADQILGILNEAIANSTALWDYKPRTLATMSPWFDAKEAGNFPVIGFVDDTNKLLAFGTYGTFRERPAYKYTVEHSLYVEASCRGRGLGTRMLEQIISRAEEQGYRTVVGGIATENRVSIATHEKCGFQPCGTIRQAGYKFGKWIDLSFYQRLLAGPSQPVEE
jgi:phosphinothricin acetyltransferase